MTHTVSFGSAIAVLSLLFVLTPFFESAARAQTVQVPPVEVGGQAGLIGAVAEGFHGRPIVGPRLTVNISQRDAVELSADTLASSSPGIYGLYFLQYKRTSRRPHDRSGVRTFITAGTGGYYAYQNIPERRLSRPDGSIVVYPAHASGELSRVSVVSFGGGFERRLSRYASFRLEGNGFLLIDSEGFPGFRVLAGVSVPIGGYRAAR